MPERGGPCSQGTPPGGREREAAPKCQGLLSWRVPAKREEPRPYSGAIVKQKTAAPQGAASLSLAVLESDGRKREAAMDSALGGERGGKTIDSVPCAQFSSGHELLIISSVARRQSL